MKKSSAYRETFRRHRVLLSLPIVIATLIGAYMVISAPKAYMSTVSLWVDNPASSTSSIQDNNPSLTPPSQQEQSVLSELLSTDTFDQQVASQSQLGSYLASNSSGGGLPLIGGGGGSTVSRIAAALSAKNVVTAVPGPQILQISFTGSTPAVAQSTLKAIVAVLQKETARYLAQHNQAALGFNESQVATAKEAVTTARNAESAYLAQHPGANQGDPAMAAAFRTSRRRPASLRGQHGPDGIQERKLGHRRQRDGHRHARPPLQRDRWQEEGGRGSPRRPGRGDLHQPPRDDCPDARQVGSVGGGARRAGAERRARPGRQAQQPGHPCRSGQDRGRRRAQQPG